MDEISSAAQPLGRPTFGRRLPWLSIAIVTAVIGLVAALRSVQPSDVPAKAAQRPPVSVATAVVERGDIPVTLNALGTVTSQYTVNVKTQIPGYLIRVDYKEGQLVHAGDFLAQIDPRPYELAAAQAGGQLRKDQALLKSAQLNLERYRTLVEQNSIARQQLDDQEALVEQYRGMVELDQAQLGTARLNLSYCHIVAPITGRVGLRLIDPGSYVQPGDTNGLVIITQLQPITVVFPLPEDSVVPVLRRLRAGATLPVVLTNRNDTARLAEGVLTTVDNQIDTTTGTLKLRAQFANEAGTLFPNQFVNVQILVDKLHDTTVIAGAAIRHGAPGDFVYLVKADNTVTVRPVKQGPSADERVAIEEGLSAGDRVVVDGIDKLRDGARVAFATKSARRVSASR